MLKSIHIFSRSCRALPSVLAKHEASTTTNIDLKALPEHKSLMIAQFGEPKDSVVLKRSKPEEVMPSKLGPKDILVKHLVSCINPADINLIQGVYGIRPSLPTIIGNEGVTRVVQVGSDVRHLKPGDLAIGVSSLGYWQSYSIRNGDEFFAVDNDLDLRAAAQLKVNPCTAYRMLKDFVDLKPGDTVIQNGANSAVGVYAIQLAKLWGIKTINVIRDRPGKEQLVDELKGLGADHVLTDTEISNVEILKPILEQTGKPKLLMNCVGGKNAVNCQRLLDINGYSVTYGAMSKQPFSLSASSLIFKNHKYVGFWVSQWYGQRCQNNRTEISNMLDEVGRLFKRGSLKSKSTTLIDFEDRDMAFSKSDNSKYMFSINKS